MTSDDLAARLDKGWAVCQQAQARGSPDLTKLEDHWLHLLALYESAQFREAPDPITTFNQERHTNAHDGMPVERTTKPWPQLVSPDASVPTQKPSTPPMVQCSLS